MASSGPEPKDVTQNEQRELKRVFDFLADFAAKQKYRLHLQPKLDRQAKILAFKKNPESVKIVDETGAELPLGVIEAELARLETEIADLQRHVDAIDAKPDAEKKIHPKDLQQALAFLGKHTEKVRACAIPPLLLCYGNMKPRNATRGVPDRAALAVLCRRRSKT